MRLFALLSCVLLLLPGAAAQEDVRGRFVQLFETRGNKALAELWTAYPQAILMVIDEDLEGSLAAWEAAPDAPDEALIRRLHERALWGAQMASEVTGRAIFLDYASAFIGWDSEQKQRFRAGQAAYGSARRAMQDGDAEAALAAARECRELALPLGDWWGSAMGLSAEGLALAELGRWSEALVAASQARLLYQQLGLVGSEYAAVRTMLAILTALERWPRALVCVNDALALAHQAQDGSSYPQLLSERAAIERELGLIDAAAATERERDGLMRAAAEAAKAEAQGR